MTNKPLQTSDSSTDAAGKAASDSFQARPFDPIRPEPIDGFDAFGYVALQKVYNTRDLGGLPTADGRHIRKNRLIRSGELHHATKSDIAELMQGHQLAAILDLRTQFEAKQNQDPILEMPGVEYIHESVLSEDEVVVGSLKALPSELQVFKAFSENAAAYMRDLYVKCVIANDGKRTYARFFQLLLNTTQGAVLWHCTQGKDRTGIAAYLIEYVLGVPDEYRKRDYVATNLYMEGWLKSVEEHLRHAHRLTNIDFDIEAYTYAMPSHLDAALSAIADSYGSLDDYIEQALGVTEDQQQQLRDLYLE